MIVSLVLALIIAGVILWAIPQLPIDVTIATIIRVVVIVALVIYVARLLVPAVGGVL